MFGPGAKRGRHVPVSRAEAKSQKAAPDQTSHLPETLIFDLSLYTVKLHNQDLDVNCGFLSYLNWDA